MVNTSQSSTKSRREFFDEISSLPVLDIHTHLVGGKLSARGLHDILLYHMSISDLYAAGCKDAGRLTEYPRWPTRDETIIRIERALPFLDASRNTSTAWCIRRILSDLYAWKAPITVDNWRKLDDIIRERADDRAWQREVVRQTGIRQFVTEFARREEGQDDDLLQYALEWGFFTRCQAGEFDTALCELERCWGNRPESPMPIGTSSRPAPTRTINSLDDVHAAVDDYVNNISTVPVLSTATHLSTDINYCEISESEMTDALSRRDRASIEERNIYASYVNERFLSALERLGDTLVFQFSIGAEPLPFETGSRLSQQTIGQLGAMVSRHPGLRFQCLLASRHANQSLCSLCRELPNLSLAGYWWHNFFPSVIGQVIEERLDMLPTNKQVGFFSDAYVVEWAYAKVQIVREVLARILSAKVEQGQYTCDEALTIAHAILFESPKTLLRIQLPSNMS